MFGILVLGAAGVYLLLSSLHDKVAPTFGWTATALAVSALGVLGVLLGRPAEWWPDSPSLSGAGTLLYFGLAACSLISAGGAVVSVSLGRCALCIGIVLASNAGLLFLLGAPVLGSVQLLLTAGGTAFVVSVLRRPDNAHLKPVEREPYEPFLACAAATLLAAVWVSTVHEVYVQEAAATVRSQNSHAAVSIRRPALPREATIRAYRDGVRTDAPANDAGRSDLSLWAALFDESLVDIVLFVALALGSTAGTFIAMNRGAAEM